MAIFDPAEQRMCVRIVYDGVGGAGKTTNLKALCGLFATQRGTELYSPGELHGRTLYFDWVQIMAGFVCGFPLMSQVISVPGQLVLTPRRRHLLETADVVVFVCDSSRAGLDRTREGLATLLDTVRRRDVPILVQANKQDHEEALSGSQLLSRLGLDGATVVEAIATEGIGVVDTFVGAVRTISRAMQARADASGFAVEVRRAPGATDVLARLRGEEIDPEWAAEMLLEEAQSALLLGEMLVTELSGETNVEAAPPALPSSDVPAGFVWPAHTGRTTLRALAEHGAPDGAFTADAQGRIEREIEGYVLRTSRGVRFVDREEARQALVRGARERTQLTQLRVPDTVLVAQPAKDGAWWIWTVMPKMTSVVDVVANRRDDARAVLDAYGVALVDLLRACLHHRFTVDLAPANFGARGGTLRYTGDIGEGDEASLCASMLGAAEMVERSGGDGDLDVFIDAVERSIHRLLTREEVTRTAAAIPRDTARAGSAARLEAVLAKAAAAA